MAHLSFKCFHLYQEVGGTYNYCETTQTKELSSWEKNIYNAMSDLFLVTIKYLQNNRLYTGLTVTMKAVCSSEMLASTYDLHAVTSQKTTI